MWRKLRLLFIVLLVFALGACSDPTERDVSITLKAGVDTIEIHSDYQDPGAQARAFGFPVSYEVLSNTVDITKLGEYEILYQVDYKGIVKQVKRIVTVIDLTKPVVTLKQGVDTVSLGDDWEDSGVEIIDNSNEECQLTITGEVNSLLVGEYIITYEVIDSSGNKTVIQRYVNVVEQTGVMN